jgi:hypothetical protein
MRELTLAQVHHPDFIDNDWMLVTHPTVDPLTQGAPDLGWEGDPRLAVYLHKPSQTFVLWRLEANGEYLPVAKYGIGQEITPASINQTIRDLIRTDSRRGFDPHDDVMARRDELERDQARNQEAYIHDFADKLLYGLSRSHLPGVDVTRIRQLPSRR